MHGFYVNAEGFYSTIQKLSLTGNDNLKFKKKADTAQKSSQPKSWHVCVSRSKDKTTKIT